jgi:hypothetical protein
MKYCFGDIVVVEDNKIGVIVKTFAGVEYVNKVIKKVIKHEVYVRDYRDIIEYDESKISRYMVRHKVLSEEEQEWQYNAEHDL